MMSDCRAEYPRDYRDAADHPPYTPALPSAAAPTQRDPYEQLQRDLYEQSPHSIPYSFWAQYSSFRALPGAMYGDACQCRESQLGVRW